jgi:hypothetical protein
MTAIEHLSGMDRAWQAARLARTYDDLRKDNRYGGAVEFFLTELYGPQDFTRRDDDLRRAWSHFKRALPNAALQVLQRTLALRAAIRQRETQLMEALFSGSTDPFEPPGAVSANLP